MGKKVKSSRELAKIMEVSESCVTRWLNKGLPHYLEGRTYCYDLTEVLKHLVKKSSRHRRIVEALSKRLASEE